MSKTVENHLRSFDLKIKTIPGDGNCQFEAVAHQLRYHGYNPGETSSDVRREVVNFIKQHPDFKFGNRNSQSIRNSQPMFSLNAGKTNETFKNYTNRMSRNGEWGDYLTLSVVSKLYNVRIILFDKTNPGGSFQTINATNGGSNPKNIYLVYRYVIVPGNRTYGHYESTCDISNKTCGNKSSKQKSVRFNIIPNSRHFKVLPIKRGNNSKIQGSRANSYNNIGEIYVFGFDGVLHKSLMTNANNPLVKLLRSL